MLKNIFILILLLNCFNSNVYAYIGPGVGGGAILAILGFLVAVIVGIFGLIWFPIKRLLKKIRHKKEIKQSKID